MDEELEHATKDEKKTSIHEKLEKRKSSSKYKSVQKNSPPNENKENISQIKQSLLEKENQCKNLFDSLQRTMAEFDNYRKRTEKEKSNIYDNATAETIEKFLPVLDNLERALNSITDTESNYYKGIQMVIKQFLSIFSDLEVEPISISPGDNFNHELHCAIAHVEDKKFGENQIADELERGYKYKDKVIRYSKVRVAN